MFKKKTTKKTNKKNPLNQNKPKLTPKQTAQHHQDEESNSGPNLVPKWTWGDFWGLFAVSVYEMLFSFYSVFLKQNQSSVFMPLILWHISAKAEYEYQEHYKALAPCRELRLEKRAQTLLLAWTKLPTEADGRFCQQKEDAMRVRGGGWKPNSLAELICFAIQSRWTKMVKGKPKPVSSDTKYVAILKCKRLQFAVIFPISEPFGPIPKPFWLINSVPVLLPSYWKKVHHGHEEKNFHLINFVYFKQRVCIWNQYNIWTVSFTELNS